MGEGACQRKAMLLIVQGKNLLVPEGGGRGKGWDTTECMPNAKKKIIQSRVVLYIYIYFVCLFVWVRHNPEYEPRRRPKKSFFFMLEKHLNHSLFGLNMEPRTRRSEVKGSTSSFHHGRTVLTPHSPAAFPPKYVYTPGSLD